MNADIPHCANVIQIMTGARLGRFCGFRLFCSCAIMPDRMPRRAFRKIRVFRFLTRNPCSSA